MSDTPFVRTDVTLANWRDWPHNRWSFQNLSELVPTAQILSGEEEGGQLGADRLRTIALRMPDGTSVSALDYLETSHGDCFVAMRDGEIVAEWSAPHGSTVQPHVIFSVTKSVTGMLAGLAVADGLLDPSAPVSRYVPCHPGSAYENATVRQLLDMSVALDFEENYLDRDGAFDRYRRAMLWNPEREPGNPETMRSVLTALPRAPRPHGERFFYASPDTDMCGLVIEAATGQRWHELLAERLWRPMGGRGPAYITVDRVGSARAAGGLCVTARDLTRFGRLVMDGGVAPDGTRLIAAEWIDDMRRSGDQRAWLAGDFKADFPNGNYRSYWYIAGDDHDCFCGIGIHGQWLWCDPVTRVVLTKFSSRPQPTDEAAGHREIAALRQIARAI